MKTLPKCIFRSCRPFLPSKSADWEIFKLINIPSRTKVEACVVPRDFFVLLVRIVNSLRAREFTSCSSDLSCPAPTHRPHRELRPASVCGHQKSASLWSSTALCSEDTIKDGSNEAAGAFLWVAPRARPSQVSARLQGGAGAGTAVVASSHLALKKLFDSTVHWYVKLLN